jgi:catechol 2,3-dioxygenase-like lactoylglutathione lyase family enzyme
MSVVVDCADPEVSSRFWQELLGYARLYDDPAGSDADAGGSEAGTARTDWITIGTPDQGGDRISFQRVDGFRPPTWPTGPTPQQMHLDVEVADLAAADERALAIGARPLAEAVVHEDETFRVYADPDGHPFCLVQRY